MVHIDLVGSANAPAVVVTQNDTAVVLFRGGNSVRNAVEEQLARRGAAKIELLVDLRTKPETPCALEAEQVIFRFLDRNYQRDGSGGLFIVHGHGDLRNVEIWYQMLWYLNDIL